MSNEDKQLLLKDICSRLPYGVKILIDNKYAKSIGLNVQTLIGIDLLLMTIIAKHNCYKFEKIKPFLRPMSSMTEEEKYKLNCLCYHNISIQDNSLCGYICSDEIVDVIDFLLKNHFDYQGLIEKGLALEAPEDMYK